MEKTVFSLGRKHWFMLKSVSDITACKKESSWKSVSAFYLIWYVNWYPKQREPEKLLYNHHLSSFNWKVLSKRVNLKSDIKVHHYTVIQKASFCDRLMDGLKDGQDLMYKQLCLSCQQATAVLCNLSKSDVMWNFMESCVYILAQNF